MAVIKYTKSALRSEQLRLLQLEKYLPTLQLKKALLQIEILQMGNALEELVKEKEDLLSRAYEFQQLMTAPDAPALFQATRIASVNKRYENIAGVEIPVFEGIDFETATYSLFDTDFWLENGIQEIRMLVAAREKIAILQERKRLLEKELREVSIRVNLFEKIMIPRTREGIKKIKIFLGDQQLAAVSQAKVAKRKIEQRNGEKRA